MPQVNMTFKIGETSMTSRFELSFDRVKCIAEEHQTPFNTIQNFLFCSFKSVRNS